MTTIWAPFCGINGKKHNENIINCPDCGARNPRVPQLGEVVDLSADDPPSTAISVYNNVGGRVQAARHQQFRAAAKKASAKQSRLVTAKHQPTSLDGTYQVVVHFYLTNYNLLDDIIQYTRSRKIGMLQY
jgi:hypothetical protein